MRRPNYITPSPDVDKESGYWPPRCIRCISCGGICIFYGTGLGDQNFYRCDNYDCNKEFVFWRIPWGHKWSHEMDRKFPDILTRILFGHERNGEWPDGMVPTIILCGTCEIGKLGYWTPEATAGFYDLTDWKDKDHRYSVSRFMCDECKESRDGKG